MNQVSPKNSGRRNWILAGLVLLAAAGVFIWLGWAKSANTPAYQTSAVTRGALTSSIGADGTLRSSHSVDLVWNSAGRVESVNVKVGDRVAANQVLAELATDSLPRSILLAEADLVTARQNLDDLLQSNSSTANAMQNLSNSRQAVKDAQDAYDTLTSQRGSSQLTSDISDQIDQTQKQLKFMEFIYRLFYEHRADGSSDKARMIVTLTQIRQNISDLTARYNWFSSQASPIEVEKSLAALNLAKAKLADAEREMERVKSGPSAGDLAAARARVAAAQSTLDQARVIAPFAGTVTQVLPLPGDRITTAQTAFRLDDLTHLFVDLQISEVDINSVEIGQAVVITLDAIPGKSYQGVVSSVDLSATSGKSGVNFKVSVTLTDADEQVKPGMTAAVAVTIKNVSNALLVPNAALRMLEGQRVVYVLKDGQPVPVNIRLGATANDISQVVGGDLKEGDLVILNPPSAAGKSTPAPVN